MSKQMRVLDPVGDQLTKSVGLAPRPAGLEGKVMAILDNCAESAGPMKIVPNYLLGALMEEVGQQHRLKEMRWYRKPVASLPTPAILNEITKEADVVLNGTCR